VVQHGVRDPTPAYAPKAVQCARCRLVFLWPPLAPEADQRFYAENAQLERTLGLSFDWDDYLRRTRPDSERRARLLAPLLCSSHCLLDVGCGYGFLLSLVKEQVAKAIGLEPGSARRTFGRSELGLDIRKPPPESACIAPASVDVASAFQVLEHIGQPRPFLAGIFEVLRPGGRLIIEVPNYADAYVSLLASYRAHHFQMAHAIYYTPATLRRVLENAGFIIESISGVQRYAFANALHWFWRGQPQRQTPSREAVSLAGVLIDRAYRAFLTGILRSDTLVCLARKPQRQRDTT
jgi:SAM-dependent methyltransferase